MFISVNMSFAMYVFKSSVLMKSGVIQEVVGNIYSSNKVVFRNFEEFVIIIIIIIIIIIVSLSFLSFQLVV